MVGAMKILIAALAALFVYAWYQERNVCLLREELGL